MFLIKPCPWLTDKTLREVGQTYQLQAVHASLDGYHTQTIEAMAATSGLYNDLLDLLGQSKNWTDIRHLKTLGRMVIGLICSE